MDRRHRPRARTALPVRVWGIDANARPFTQLATVKNVSENGILLNGLSCRLRVGAVVDVQYNGHTAEFLVIWMGKLGRQVEIGLQRLSAQPCIWDAYVGRAAGLEANG